MAEVEDRNKVELCVKCGKPIEPDGSLWELCFSCYLKAGHSDGTLPERKSKVDA